MPTACLSQALDTRASTTVERVARHGRSSSGKVRLSFSLSASICPTCGLQKICLICYGFTNADNLKPLASGELFELDLEVHHILLAGAVSGCAGIEAQATGLIKVPLGLLAV